MIQNDFDKLLADLTVMQANTSGVQWKILAKTIMTLQALHNHTATASLQQPRPIGFCR